MTTMRHGEFCWLDFKTFDVTATGRLLADEFGWECLVDVDDWRGATKARFQGHWIAGISGLDNAVYPPGTPPHTSFYLGVADVEHAFGTAIEHGAESLIEPVRIADEGLLATFTDPLGAVVSLWQPIEFIGWAFPAMPGAPRRMLHESAAPDAAASFYRGQLGLPLHDADFIDRLPRQNSVSATWHFAMRGSGLSTMELVHLASGHEYIRLP